MQIHFSRHVLAASARFNVSITVNRRLRIDRCLSNVCEWYLSKSILGANRLSRSLGLRLVPIAPCRFHAVFTGTMLDSAKVMGDSDVSSSDCKIVKPLVDCKLGVASESLDASSEVSSVDSKDAKPFVDAESCVDTKSCVDSKLRVDSNVTRISASSETDATGHVSVGTQRSSRFTHEDDILIVVLRETNSDIEHEPDSELDDESTEKDRSPGLEASKLVLSEKRKAEDGEPSKDPVSLKKAKLETKALKAKRPGFTDDRYNETSYYIENGLRKVYPYYFTFTTFTKGRWLGEKILDVFAREFRAHPAEEYERCIRAGTLTVNYEKVDVDYKLKHNDLLANIVHRHEVPVTCRPISIVHLDEDLVVVNKPASIPVHPCGRYRHNTVVFILAKEYNLKNLRTIHRLDRLTSGLLLFGRTPKKARSMEQQIRCRQVQKEYVCRVEGEFPDEVIECNEPIEVVSYKIGVCKVSPTGKTCTTTFQKLGYNGTTSIISCKPHTGRMHQIRVHLQYLGYPVVNDPLYNHVVFGPEKGKNGAIGKSDEDLIRDLIHIHNAENWLGMDGDTELSMFKPGHLELTALAADKGCVLAPGDGAMDDGDASREASPCEDEGDASPTATTRARATPPANNMAAAAACHTKVTVATQTGQEAPDLAFHTDKMSSDPHCYECKVRYRDPKPRDLVMYLHAWKYKGPGWGYETELPEWAGLDWVDDGDV